MSVEVAAHGSFDAEPLLRGFEWLGAALAQQTAATEQLGVKLDGLSQRTEAATSSSKSFLETTVRVNAGLELAKKAFHAVETGIRDMVSALEAASNYSRVLEGQFGQTRDRVQDLTIAFAKAAEKSGALNGIFNTTQTALIELATWLGSKDGGDAINEFFQLLAKTGSITALVLGTIVHQVNEIQDAFARISKVREGGLAAIGALFGERPANPDDLESILYRVYEMLDRASNAPKTDKAPKPKSYRGQDDFTGGYEGNVARVTAGWLNERIQKDMDDSRNQQEGLGRLRRDEERAAKEHDDQMAQLRAADLFARQEYARGVLSGTVDFLRQLAVVSEGGVVAQARIAEQLTAVFDQVSGAFADLTIAATKAIVAGTETLFQALGNLLAGMLDMLGEMLERASVGIGIFALLTGDLAAVGLAAAAFATGVGLQLAAGAIRGHSGGAPSSGGGGGGGGGGVGGSYTSTFSGYTPPPAGGGGTTVVNVNLGRGFVFGTPREVGQQIKQLIRQADTLSPSLGGMGG